MFNNIAEIERTVSLTMRAVSGFQSENKLKKEVQQMSNQNKSGAVAPLNHKEKISIIDFSCKDGVIELGRGREATGYKVVAWFTLDEKTKKRQFYIAVRYTVEADGIISVVDSARKTKIETHTDEPSEDLAKRVSAALDGVQGVKKEHLDSIANKFVTEFEKDTILLSNSGERTLEESALDVIGLCTKAPKAEPLTATIRDLAYRIHVKEFTQAVRTHGNGFSGTEIKEWLYSKGVIRTNKTDGSYNYQYKDSRYVAVLKKQFEKAKAEVLKCAE